MNTDVFDANKFVGKWFVLEHGFPPPPWSNLLRQGTDFQISKDENGDFWLLPDAGATSAKYRLAPYAPENGARKMGQSKWGVPLPGALGVQIDSDIGYLYFTLNAVGASRRFISVSHDHLPVSMVAGSTHTGDGHSHDSEVATVTHGGSHGVDN